MTPSTCLSEHLLQTVMALLHSDVAEHGRHLAQYFHLFVMYASLGATEKQQLLINENVNEADLIQHNDTHCNACRP